jgi:hypothetical protein
VPCRCGRHGLVSGWRDLDVQAVEHNQSANIKPDPVKLLNTLGELLQIIVQRLVEVSGCVWGRQQVSVVKVRQV